MTIKEELKDLEDKVAEGLRNAHKKMLEFKKFKKTPVIVSQNGKVVKLYPEDFESKN